MILNWPKTVVFLFQKTSNSQAHRLLPGVTRATATPGNHPRTWAPAHIARLQGKTGQRNSKTNDNVSSKLNLDFELAQESDFPFSKKRQIHKLIGCYRGVRGLPQPQGTTHEPGLPRTLCVCRVKPDRDTAKPMAMFLPS